MSEPVRAPVRLKLSMFVAMAIGLGYVVWLAWAEGWRLWVVVGVMALVGGLGGAVHLAMGLARQREGLDGRPGEEGVRHEASAQGNASTESSSEAPRDPSSEPGGDPSHGSSGGER